MNLDQLKEKAEASAADGYHVLIDPKYVLAFVEYVDANEACWNPTWHREGTAKELAAARARLFSLLGEKP